MALVLSLGMVTLSCNESLPPYLDPTYVFSSGLSGLYVISPADNSLRIYLTVRNEYDETFDSVATMTGQIEITWIPDPSFKRTLSVSGAQLIDASGYDPATGRLTFDPGDSIRFGVRWDFVSDSGDSLQPRLEYHPDPNCSTRQLSEDVYLYVTGSVDLYPRTSTVVPDPFQFVFVHHRRYVSPRDCP